MKSTASTSAKILDVAQGLIVAGGYNGFSYADISAAIGIRKASIHHHFPTKAELVAVLVDRYLEEAGHGLAALTQAKPSPLAQIEAYLDFWRICIRDSTQPFCVCAMLASELQGLPPDVASGVREHFRRLAAWLAAVLRTGAEQGLFHLSGTPEDEAHRLMAAVHGAMLSARAFDDPELFATIAAGEILRLRGGKMPTTA